VVHAVFSNFAPGEAARHIPRVWELTTPEAAIQARAQGCAAALRRILGDLVGGPGLLLAADLATKAALSAPTEGRVMYAALTALAVPEDLSSALGTPPPCRASIAATATSPHSSRTGSAGQGPTSSWPWTWACRPRSSAGSTTCLPRSWERCRRAACSWPGHTRGHVHACR
jgi:hypothetical protein